VIFLLIINGDWYKFTDTKKSTIIEAV